MSQRTVTAYEPMDDETTTRTVRDALGDVTIPAGALWGAQTQRAVQNFGIGDMLMPVPFIRALGLVKWAAATANGDLGQLEQGLSAAIAAAAIEVAAGQHDAQFPVDVFQTGSGTSSNMNANEVIAALATRRLGAPVHPNDHVNRGQSSNDTIPTALHVAALQELRGRVLPALERLADAIEAASARVGGQVKTGRTHLMDALPMRLSQELGAWRSQVTDCIARLRSSEPRMLRIAQGATAIGTGLNAHPDFGRRVALHLARRTGIPFEPAPDLFAALSAQDGSVELSGQLRVAAVCMTKIANDLRWMNSGPLAGLGEISLPALQPGSSIMPGKVNPVIPEAVAMACAAVVGNDSAITIAGQSGNFQLNVMLPLIAHSLLQSERLIANSADALAAHAFPAMTVNSARLESALARNPVLVTALNPVIGYDRAAEIARRAYAEGRPIVELAAELTGLDPAELERLLDPQRLADGGIIAGSKE
jgi:fumarate hydratase class II